MEVFNFVTSFGVFSVVLHHTDLTYPRCVAASFYNSTILPFSQNEVGEVRVLIGGGSVFRGSHVRRRCTMSG